MSRPPKLPPILPLEYCRIERASELLSCKVEDILHWAATDKIALFLSAEQLQSSTIKDECNELIEVPSGKVIFMSPNSLYTREVMSKNGRDKINDHAYISTDDEWRHIGENFNGALLFWRGVASGFWRIVGNSVYQFLYGRSGIGKQWAFLVEHSSHDNAAWFMALVHVDAIGDMNNQLYIMRDDLLLLHKHIGNGLPIPARVALAYPANIDEDPITIAAQMLLPHPTAERHAVNREKILAAAIYAKHKWPNECGDKAISWAETLSNHESTLFEAGVAPLSVEKIAGILSEAMGTGRPRKKK